MSPCRTLPRMTVRPPSHAVVKRVAEEEGVDPEELVPPLSEKIDAEALDRLLEGNTVDGTVELRFEWLGYQIRVDDDGCVEVTDE